MTEHKTDDKKLEARLSSFGAVVPLLITVVQAVLSFSTARSQEGNEEISVITTVVAIGIALLSLVITFLMIYAGKYEGAWMVTGCAIVLELCLLIPVCISTVEPTEPTVETESTFIASTNEVTESTTTSDSNEFLESPQIDIYLVSAQEGILQLAASTNPSGCSILWSSRDESIATVSDSGIVQAVSPGTVRLEATVVINGETYNDSIMATIESTSEEIDSGEIFYFEAQPEELANWPTSGNTLLSDHDIHYSKNEALSSVGIQNVSGCDVSSGTVIGYVYYHWCRGEDLKATESHNRTSGETKGLHYSNMLQQYVDCNTFSCFFSTKYLSEESMKFADDGTGCMWFENYDICHDSYWYWAVPVYEAQYTLTQTVLNITVPD